MLNSRKRFCIGAVLGMVAILMPPAWASASIDRAVLFADLSGGTVEAALREEAKSDQSQLPQRKLSFCLIDGNKRVVLRTIDIADVPLSIFRLSDNSDLVFTTWTTGSAFRLRVFAVSGRTVNEVLDIGSKDPPGFIFGSSPTVLIPQSSKETPWIAYVWTNGKFQQQPATVTVGSH